MAVTPKLEIKQSQSLLMTPQLRQAINLLQMNNLELGELVAKELESNPLLEKEDDKLNDSDISDQTIDDYDQHPEDEEQFAEDIDYENAFDDAGSDREGYEPSWLDYNASLSPDNDDFDYLEQRAHAEESAYDLLNRQIEQYFTKPKDRLIASRMTEFLDGAGYFTGNIHLIAEQLKIDEKHLTTILNTLQTFEPAGVFATSLKECLRIQLADKNLLDEMMLTFLDHLELLAKGDLKSLKKICRANDEDIATMITDIKSLNPKPLAQYQSDNNSYIIPDVYVHRSKYGEYTVELNQDTLPRVLINQEYKRRINLTDSDKNTHKYLKEQLSNAHFLVKALHQRADTILRICEQIIRYQRDFFEYGINHLKPMLLRDIAEAVEMHESTVSRVTSHKYMRAPNGIFELKYFFSNASGMYNGDNQTSTTSIKYKIKQLIEKEGNHILSDDAIVECLAAQSIKIARRTVAKYRDEMKIPTSAQRKRRLRKVKL